MKRIFIIMLILLTSQLYSAFDKKIGNVPEIAVPSQMKIDGDRLYIIDQKTVNMHIYSLKKFSYIKTVLNKGEGPREFKYSPRCSIYPDFIYLYGYFKGMYLQRDGSYKSEFKTKYRFNNFSPIGKNFVGWRHGINNRNQRPYSEVSIYTDNKTFQPTKMIYYYDFDPISVDDQKTYRLFESMFDVTLDDNKIFIWDPNGASVLIFDSNGKELDRIKLNIEKQKLSQAFKEKYIEYMKEQGSWNYLNSHYRVTFPEHFPYFFRFEVNNGKMYFLTYNMQGNNREVIITDMKGKILKKRFVPMTYFVWGGDFTIDNDKFYYLIENDETEEWELHVIDLK